MAPWWCAVNVSSRSTAAAAAAVAVQLPPSLRAVSYFGIV